MLQWFQALFAWPREREPLAQLVRGDAPIPDEIRKWLGELLGGNGSYHYRDRLVLVESKALHRSINTFIKRFETWVFVQKYEANHGVPLTDAKQAAARHFGKSISYVEHCMALGRTVHRRLTSAKAKQSRKATRAR